MKYICPDCKEPLNNFSLIRCECQSCGFDWVKFHIIPVNDLREHTESHLCECNPVLKFDAGTLIVHNSFDGREGVEWANQLLNNP